MAAPEGRRGCPQPWPAFFPRRRPHTGVRAGLPHHEGPQQAAGHLPCRALLLTNADQGDRDETQRGRLANRSLPQEV